MGILRVPWELINIFDSARVGSQKKTKPKQTKAKKTCGVWDLASNQEVGVNERS